MPAEHVHRYIDAKRDQALDTLKALVRQPSVSAQDHGVKECARVLADIMGAMAWRAG